MSWVNLLQPNLIVNGTILSLTLEMVLEQGLQGLILDVDETLLPASSGQLSPAMKQWVAEFKPQVKLALVSNNLNVSRIQAIAQELDLPFYFGAGKPSRRKLRQAMEAIGVPDQTLGIVGDRLFTDVLGGNRLGLFTILVEPVLPEPGEMSLLSLIKGPWVRRTEFQLSRWLGAKF